MSEIVNEEFVTYTVSKRDGLVHHIEHLERTLTKRNARILELEQRLDAETADQPSQPITLEHREGEYVHLHTRSAGNVFVEFVNDAWRWAGESRDYPYTPETVERWIENGWTIQGHGFLAPGAITKATPPEPTTFGYVGTVVDECGNEWDVMHDYAPASVAYTCVSRRTGAYNGSRDWAFVLALGTFEGVVR